MCLDLFEERERKREREIARVARRDCLEKYLKVQN